MSRRVVLTSASHVFWQKYWNDYTQNIHLPHSVDSFTILWLNATLISVKMFSHISHNPWKTQRTSIVVLPYFANNYSQLAFTLWTIFREAAGFMILTCTKKCFVYLHPRKMIDEHNLSTPLFMKPSPHSLITQPLSCRRCPIGAVLARNARWASQSVTSVTWRVWDFFEPELDATVLHCRCKWPCSSQSVISSFSNRQQ